MTTNQLQRYYAKMQETIRQEYAGLNRRSLRDPELIFVGDSIIHLFPLEELLETRQVLANRGLSAYTSRDLLDHLDIHVFGQSLRTLFVLIGTNDIGLGLTLEESLSNLRAIFDQVREAYPLLEIKLIPILPTNPSPEFEETVGIRSNSLIREWNQAYQELEEAYPNLEVLTLPVDLFDDKGNLKSSLTKDGLHLNQQGYLILAGMIQAQLSL